MVYVKFLPQEPNIFNQVHCFLGLHCKYSFVYRKHFPRFYRAKKLKWKFPRTGNVVVTGMAEVQCFYSLSNSLKRFSLLVHIFPQGLGILCSPLHGDVGAVTRTVGLKHNELIDTSVPMLSSVRQYSATFSFATTVFNCKKKKENRVVTG